MPTKPQPDVALLVFPKLGINQVLPQPPLALLTLAPYIEAKGLVPIVVDQRVDRGHRSKIRELLPRARLVAISSITGEQLHHAIELIAYVKALSPGTPVVFGGVHASLLPEQTAATAGIDLVATGEGEGVIGEIVDHYAGRRDLGTIRGIAYRHQGQIVSTPPRDLLDLTQLKLPAWHLVDARRYSDFTVQTGRGCPHNCSFCHNATYNRRRWRFREPQSILEEISLLYHRYGARDFRFVDDNFFTSFERVAELCRLIVQANLSLRWQSSLRADYFKRLTPDFVDLLKRSGAKRFFVGAESGSRDVLQRIDKQIDVDDILAAAEISRRYGLGAQVSFMSGFPFERAPDRAQTFALMDRLRQINPAILVTGINVYTPYPGTELYEESKRAGLREPDSLAAWGGYVWNRSNLPWLSRAENAQLENVSFISRFFFWRRAIEESYLKPWHYPFFWALRASATVRWPARWFRFAPEWDLFRFVRRTLLY